MSKDRKSVLMFCPSFFGYEKRIAGALCEQGFDVDLYDERPSNSFFSKTFLRLNFGFYKPVVQKYLQKIISEKGDKQYDFVLVVKSEAFGEKELSLLRHAYPKAEFILYLWDSVKNIPDGEKKISLYDRALTFDPNDAEKYNIPFLPIPYGKEYTPENEGNIYEYEAAFIGTAHSVRPRIVKEIKEQCEQMGKKCFAYFYSPHLFVYFLNKLTNRDYKYISLKDINFKPLSTEEVCKVYNSSKCVLDIEHPRQSGTTTRPVEMLPMNKKIITTNVFVKKFEFFNDNNFCIIDRDNPTVDPSFFDKPYLPVDDAVLYKYSGQNFVKTLLEQGGN